MTCILLGLIFSWLLGIKPTLADVGRCRCGVVFFIFQIGSSGLVCRLCLTFVSNERADRDSRIVCAISAYIFIVFRFERSIPSWTWNESALSLERPCRSFFLVLWHLLKSLASVFLSHHGLAFIDLMRDFVYLFSFRIRDFATALPRFRIRLLNLCMSLSVRSRCSSLKPSSS